MVFWLSYNIEPDFEVISAFNNKDAVSKVIKKRKHSKYDETMYYVAPAQRVSSFKGSEIK